MTTTTQDHPATVRSADGTPIAVFRSGRGRPLVVVHGTTSDHTTWRLVTSLLGREVAVHAVDRRGRGASGDGTTYSLELEHADIAAVVDAAAQKFGGPVDLLGHSYGGNVAFGAARLTDNVRRLVLYEGWPPPDVAHRSYEPGLLARMDEQLAEGRPDELLDLMFREIVKMSEAEIAAIKAAPTWPARLAAAPTVPREVRSFGRHAFDPTEARQIRVPVLLLVGEDSPSDLQADPGAVAAALPDARLGILPGQMHMAHLTDPASFAETVLSFLRE